MAHHVVDLLHLLLVRGKNPVKEVYDRVFRPLLLANVSFDRFKFLQTCLYKNISNLFTESKKIPRLLVDKEWYPKNVISSSIKLCTGFVRFVKHLIRLHVQ